VIVWWRNTTKTPNKLEEMMDITFKEMREKMGGLYVLTSTPFKANFDLDVENVKKNIRNVIDNGINGENGILVPGAGFGEGVYLTLEEHRDLVKAVLTEADGEIPVFPGVHLNGSLEAEKYCKELQDMGAAGLQLAPPSAYSVPSDDDIVAYYKGIAEAAPKLGIIAYCTHWEWGLPPHRDMSPDLIGRLFEIDNFVGVKWSSKTFSNFMECLRQHAEKGLFYCNYDNEALIPFHMMGGKGLLCHEFAPWHYLKLKSLLEERKYAEAWDEIERWELPWARLEGDIVSQGGSGIGVSKALLEVYGLHAGPPRPPQKPLTRAQYERIENLVEETGIMEH